MPRFNETPCRTACARLLPLCLLMMAACAPTDAPPATDVAAEDAAIRALLMQQQADWNSGDIDAFMQGYWPSDSLRFISGGTIRRGWQTTLERYHRAYPDRSAMGTLTFDDLDIRLLTPRWAVVAGAWHLRRTGDYADVGGRYTLLLEKQDAGWRIVHDHTSTADA